MALPPIVFAKKETIRLISPTDPAIDADATSDEALEAYTSGDSDDAASLSLRHGVDPVWFVVRSLTPREMRILRSVVAMPADDETQLATMVRLIETGMQFLRFGLVDVEGWEGWAGAERERLFGLRVWTEETIAAMPDGVLMFLGSAVMRHSTLSEKKSGSAGSSPGKRNGINGRRSTASGKGRGRSTAKRAKATHKGA